MQSFLNAYLLRRLNKIKANGGNDPYLENLLSRPWDGKAETLPHFRGCQVFPASYGIGEMRCTCGITKLAGRRKAGLLLFAMYRCRACAKYVRRFVHPILRWRSLKGEQRMLSRFFRALGEDAAAGIRAANCLMRLAPNHPQKPESGLRFERPKEQNASR